MSIYLVGSLRNPLVPQTAKALRDVGYDVFDDWYAAGERADDSWQAYEEARGRSFLEALRGEAARHTFTFDLRHLQMAELGVMVMPAGKSAHMEFGWLLGRGRPSYVLLSKAPDRWDVMYQLAWGVCSTVEELLGLLEKNHPLVEVRDE